MRVNLGAVEITLYIGNGGMWTMHIFDLSRPEGEQYLVTHYNVSEVNPFASTVTYDAWR